MQVRGHGGNPWRPGDGDAVPVSSILNQWDGLAVPRAGHSTTQITGGLLDGGVIISGGLSSLEGQPSFAVGSEFFMP